MRSRERRPVSHGPTSREASQPGKHDQALARCDGDRALNQPEGKAGRNPQRPQPVAAAPRQPAAVNGLRRPAGSNVGKQHAGTDRPRTASRLVIRRRHPFDRVLDDHGPTAQPPPRVGQLEVGHQQIARTNSPRHVALHAKPSQGQSRQSPVEPQRPGQDPGQHQQQIDLPGHGRAEDQHQHGHVVAALATDGGSAWAFHDLLLTTCSYCTPCVVAKLLILRLLPDPRREHTGRSFNRRSPVIVETRVFLQ